MCCILPVILKLPELFIYGSAYLLMASVALLYAIGFYYLFVLVLGFGLMLLNVIQLCTLFEAGMTVVCS